jgi:hypothetical protein
MKRSLNHQSADDIVNRTNNTFSFTILWGRVRTRHPELCAIRQEEEAGGRVVKLTPIVALDSFDSPVKLSRHIGKEMRQNSEGVRFKFQGESPLIMSIIIKNGQIILRTRHTNNRRCPKIKLYKIKRMFCTMR